MKFLKNYFSSGTVDQCVYTRLQQHEVWSNMQFWEMSFFSDVQRSIRAVYLSNEEFAAEQEKENHISYSDNSSTRSSSNLDGITDPALGSGDTFWKKTNKPPINFKS